MVEEQERKKIKFGWLHGFYTGVIVGSIIPVLAHVFAYFYYYRR